MNQETQDKLDTAVFRRLLSHLDNRKDVQNIDLMTLAGFCRNCFGKWYKSAADDHGIEMTDAEAKARIYGMAYEDWKEQLQTPATPEQMAAFESRKN